MMVSSRSFHAARGTSRSLQKTPSVTRLTSSTFFVSLWLWMLLLLVWSVDKDTTSQRLSSSSLSSFSEWSRWTLFAAAEESISSGAALTPSTNASAAEGSSTETNSSSASSSTGSNSTNHTTTISHEEGAESRNVNSSTMSPSNSSSSTESSSSSSSPPKNTTTPSVINHNSTSTNDAPKQTNSSSTKMPFTEKPSGTVEKTLFPYSNMQFEDPKNMYYEESIEDVYTHQRVPHPEISREDMVHTPLVSPLGYQASVGMALSSYTTSGIHLSPEERGSLGWHESEIGVRSQRRLKARELFEEMIRGDSTDVPFGLSHITDLYYKQQVDTAIIHQLFCDRFIALLHAQNRPALVVHLFLSQIANFTYHCLYDRREDVKGCPRKFVVLSTEGDGDALYSFRELQTVNGESNPAQWEYLLNHPNIAHWYSINGNIRHPNFTPIPEGVVFYHRSGRNFMPFDPERKYKEEYRNNLMTRVLLEKLNLQQVFPKVKTGPIQFAHYDPLFLEHALEVFTGGMLFAPGTWEPLQEIERNITTVYLVLKPLNQFMPYGQERPGPYLDAMVMINDSPSQYKENVKHIALLPFTAALFYKLQQFPFGDPARKLRVLVSKQLVHPGDITVTNRDHLPTTSKGTIHPFLMSSDLAHVVEETGTEEWYHALNQNTFVACPLEDRYDSSCIWEALVFGAIPIVEIPDYDERLQQQKFSTEGAPSYQAKKKVLEDRFLSDIKNLEAASFLDAFEGLPVVVVKGKEGLTSSNLKIWKGMAGDVNPGLYNLDTLFLDSWVSKIQTHPS